ncbi:cytochrome c nitrite reductase small subunit [Chondrinema litorale]|uniref:cytochrome c nitrite reductase small subunit n=1 Tax=Chondrinema litorale TaxID=2994555 RepID=UPI002543D320|nr:cytochrome c nitrite reductase small subunit [Chondrinema litorale]UZR98905.1 cytochrome c nitrite reductase small subunit [Chondrinema litorale]
MAFFHRLIPPKQWQPAVIILLGIMVGLGVYIAKISNVTSYLTDDPKACINCHVMTTEYITWNHSAHRQVATCNDCHVPHNNVFEQYAFKAKDGLYHATIYTLRTEPQAIIMHEAGQQAVQSNCIRCHFDQVTDAQSASWVQSHLNDRLDRTCWECHRETPHGRVKSLSAVGFHLDPVPIKEQRKLFIPEWLKKATETKDEAHE